MVIGGSEIKKNTVDLEKSYIPSQWDSAVLSWQHVVEQCHPGNMWPSIVMKQNYDQVWIHVKNCNWWGQRSEEHSGFGKVLYPKSVNFCSIILATCSWAVSS